MQIDHGTAVINGEVFFLPYITNIEHSAPPYLDITNSVVLFVWL